MPGPVRWGAHPGRKYIEEGTGCVTVPKIDVSKFIEQSGIRKARFGGYETADVRQAMQALCIEYEQRLNRAESHAKALVQQNNALEQHCQNLTAQNRRLAEQSAALAGNSETYSRQRAELDSRLNQIGLGRIVDGVGRGVVLDRDKNYDKVKRAYDALTDGLGAWYS